MEGCKGTILFHRQMCCSRIWINFAESSVIFGYLPVRKRGRGGKGAPARYTLAGDVRSAVPRRARLLAGERKTEPT